MVIPPVINASASPDPGGGPGEQRLSPYITLGGLDMFGEKVPDLATPAECAEELNVEPLKRFTLSVAPLQGVSGPFPNDGANKFLVNLDTEHLYTATGRYGSYGNAWEAPSPDGDAQCYDKYGTSNGAYTIPVPVQGLPIEFRKVYFRGTPVDEYGKIIGCSGGSGSSGANAYYAYFACSKPTLQPCTGDEYDTNDGSGCSYNPRNENFGIMDGEVVDWATFDIGGGGGGGGGLGGGCSDVYSMMSGRSWLNEETGVFASGCGGQSGSGVISSTVTFLATGTATGHSSGNFKFALRSKEYDTDYGGEESGPQFLVHMDGLGHVFTGFKSTHHGEYKAINRGDHFTFRGVSGIRTQINGRRLHIGGPNFTSSGCLSVNTTTSTNTVSYGLDKTGVLNCLGYEENKVRMLIATGEYPDGPPQGGITSWSGEDGTPYFNLCDFTILRRCPDDDDVMLSGCCEEDVGACCIPELGCVSRTESACADDGGTYYGNGTNCTDTLNDGESAPYYGYTISQLCEYGIGCVYNSDYKPGAGTSIIGYECYAGAFGSQTTRRDYLDHIYSDEKYHADQWAGIENASTFHVGETCASYQCPTTTSTSTSTTSTSTSTTTPI